MEELAKRYQGQPKNIKPVRQQIERTKKNQFCTLKYRLVTPKTQDYTTLGSIAKDLGMHYDKVWRIYKNQSLNNFGVKIIDI